MNEGSNIPFHRPWVGEEEVAAVREVLLSGWLTTGSRCEAFERAFSEYVGARHAVAVSSGTAALHLGLLAAGVGPGDRVLTTTFTFAATVEAILYCGAEPVLVDVDPETLNLDPDAVERLLEGPEGDRLRAILPVHYGGQPAAMERILPLAERHGIPVVEDAAHALPAARLMNPDDDWRTVGTIGAFTAFSFYATKTLTTAEGGMVTCANDDAAELLRSLRLHGLSTDAWRRHDGKSRWRYEVERAGYKYNLPDVLAAIGLVQLGRCDAATRERGCLAETYCRVLAPLERHLALPVVEPEARSAWHLFPIRLRRAESRDAILDRLRARGIGVSVHFVPIHLHPYYADRFGWSAGDHPRAEEAFASLICLPIYPGLSESDIARVATSLEQEIEAS